MPRVNEINYRNAFIDMLKGVAIVVVVFYHLGAFKYGWFAVDMFLVINGYLITNSIGSRINSGNFSPFRYLVRRFARLWPLVVAVGLVALIIGYFTMLPDDLENVAESVVASNFFGNNILSTITERDYWDVKQEYKPLMHLWYVGMIAQFYVAYILLVAVIKKISDLRGKDFDKILFGSLVALTSVGLLLYLTCRDAGYRFYLPAYRFWEMTFGGLLVFCSGKTAARFRPSVALSKNKAMITLLLLATVLIFIGNNGSLSVTLLIITVLISGAMVVGADAFANFNGKRRSVWSLVAAIGACSYSIFIWHQPILAFYRYVITATPGWLDYAAYFVIVAAVGSVSYLFVEKRLKKLPVGKESTVLALSAVGCVVTTVAGLLLYANAGVVRDVPELDVFKNNVHRGMHAEYNDRVYNMDRDFSDDGRIKVLVVGNSFARDWVNVLLESDIADSLDISYVSTSQLSKKHAARINKADYVFSVASTKIHDNVFDDLIDRFISQDAPWYGIGTKQYGDSNGNIYSKRNSADYYSQTVSFKTVARTYKTEKKIWNDYIDFIAPVLHENGEISAFTDDNKYISQDTRHLTQAGARFYARIFDLRSIFGL